MSRCPGDHRGPWEICLFCQRPDRIIPAILARAFESVMPLQTDKAKMADCLIHDKKVQAGQRYRYPPMHERPCSHRTERRVKKLTYIYHRKSCGCCQANNGRHRPGLTKGFSLADRESNDGRLSDTSDPQGHHRRARK